MRFAEEEGTELHNACGHGACQQTCEFGGSPATRPDPAVRLAGMVSPIFPFPFHPPTQNQFVCAAIPPACTAKLFPTDDPSSQFFDVDKRFLDSFVATPVRFLHHPFFSPDCCRRSPLLRFAPYLNAAGCVSSSYGFLLSPHPSPSQGPRSLRWLRLDIFDYLFPSIPSTSRVDTSPQLRARSHLRGTSSPKGRTFCGSFLISISMLACRFYVRAPLRHRQTSPAKFAGCDEGRNPVFDRLSNNHSPRSRLLSTRNKNARPYIPSPRSDA